MTINEGNQKTEGEEGNQKGKKCVSSSNVACVAQVTHRRAQQQKR